MTVDLERLVASRAAQGLPPKIADPVAIRKLAVLFAAPAISANAVTPPTPGRVGGEPSTKSEGRRTHGDPRSEAAG